MILPSVRKCLIVSLVGLSPLAGCNESTQPRPLFSPAQTRPASSPQAGAHDDVYKVVCFYPPNMWQSFDAAGDRNPEGFVFVMYLLSQKSDKGVYADGTLHVDLFCIDHLPDAPPRRSLVQNWSVHTSELPRRKETRLGAGYQPSLYWGDADVLGKEVQIVVRFESASGKVLQSQTVHKRVPKPVA